MGFALAEVKYAAGDIKPMVIETVKKANKRVEARIDNIAGVKVPVFSAVDTAETSSDSTGLSKGGQRIAKARTTFAKSVDVLVQLASLQTSFKILDEDIKSELDELEREEFFRLKRSQDKKKKEIAAKEAEKKAAEAAAGEPASMLEKGVDKDVTF